MSDGHASILIVDDRPDKLLALEASVEDLDITIVRAFSGREALRRILEREFAVILLDVNMPGMDGFETATMIRQRKSSEHVPIIFITAFGDEIHMSRGYQLGAVDFILAPVNPAVLRSKVEVFVELYRKNAQLTRQAEFLRRRALQLQKLAAASVAINSALSIDQMLQIITNSARDIIGSHQAITLLLQRPSVSGGKSEAQAITSFSDKYAVWRSRELNLDAIARTVVAQSRTATRLSESELQHHPDWEIVRLADVPPIRRGIIAAPLSSRAGSNIGVIYVAEGIDGEFTHDDEAVLVQLAQLASVAIENTLYVQEREANRVKDEFLATLSHELRTPLNAIIGWTQLLKMESTPEELSHGLDVVERNAKSQVKLIEDLLDVSRITSGKMRLSRAIVKLRSLVTASCDALRPTVEQKGLTLERNFADQETPVLGDHDRLQQVVWNLLVNASKFTPEGGKITVTTKLDSEGAAVELTVSDTGIGIEPEFLPFVFDRFRQGDSSSTRAHGGLGIGLTVVRHIVELHGGSVRVHSEGKDRGTSFTITLPLARQETDGSDATPVRSAPLLAAGPDLRGLQVLIVDDEPDAGEVQAQILRRYGASVTAVSTAGEASALVRSDARINVLVSDIAMPEQDGYSLIREIRRLPGARGGIPAIALTAYARSEDRQRALDAGFHEHLIKPVDPKELAAAVLEAARKGSAENQGVDLVQNVPA